MGPQLTTSSGSVLALQVIFLMLFMFPDFSLMLWRAIIKKWAMTGEKMLMRRSRGVEKKYKKYWEIDMRKFK